MTRLIVSAIIINDKGEVFLQKRYKPKASPAYLDVWEIPAGGVDDGEDVAIACLREVKEECGLDVQIVDSQGLTYLADNKDVVKAFNPFMCQQMVETEHGLGWVGFAFVCHVVGGELKMQTEEAKDPTWVTIEHLRELLKKPEEFFSLQVPVLQKFTELFLL